MKKQYAIYCIFNFHRIILTVHILDFLLYINYIFAYIFFHIVKWSGKWQCKCGCLKCKVQCAPQICSRKYECMTAVESSVCRYVEMWAEAGLHVQSKQDITAKNSEDQDRFQSFLFRSISHKYIECKSKSFILVFN